MHSAARYIDPVADVQIPRDRFVESNRLRLHMLEWGAAGPTVLLLHGFLEHAHTWDLVAPSLAEAGFRVLALDWRGHGDSERIGRGGYYHFADYVADLAGLTRALRTSVTLVGHSMGANAALLYAGTEPTRVTALVCVDSLGPPDADPSLTTLRYAQWISDLERVSRTVRRGTTVEAAVARLQERFPRFSLEVARHLVLHGTIADGATRAWKFDPRHQTASPQPYYARQATAFWEAVRCPSLLVEGGQSPFRLAEAEIAERVRAIGAERVTVADAGHHPHLERPREFCEVLIPFLRRNACTD